MFYLTLLEYSFEKNDGILAEWGRHGSVRADTLGKRSHGLQEGFEMPPGPLGGHILIKNWPTDPKIKITVFFRIFVYTSSRSTAESGLYVRK